MHLPLYSFMPLPGFNWMHIYFCLLSWLFSCVNENIRVRWLKKKNPIFLVRVLAYWTPVLPCWLVSTPFLSEAPAFPHSSLCPQWRAAAAIWTLAFTLCNDSKSTIWCKHYLQTCVHLEVQMTHWAQEKG